ncbi:MULTISPECIES: acyl carrier protein [unclassified Ensifer]|uniref:acyl carrier protein n=1 Tax=unclassified Ensifer TaxID=2633371 RepID=UPI000812F88C|nr:MULTISPECIES: acyl carrier protein [unclassified Ensifer]OCP03073.1 acyl carrier protein [Ensifer sp. LC14]OCP08135.1 acyl carrier protein [Ensifer sp. LC11]OCP08807.1 acyl carrier protein [Ensifer sp. LC13]OCP32176.1 acyl carrier protein [Ensifer sp. LC499]
MEEIYERLETIFRDVFDDDSLLVTSELTARDVEGWDSMMNVQLMLSVERAFNVHFSASQIASLGKVGDLAALIKRMT